jgi:hypothetical protein
MLRNNPSTGATLAPDGRAEPSDYQAEWSVVQSKSHDGKIRFTL